MFNTIKTDKSNVAYCFEFKYHDCLGEKPNSSKRAVKPFWSILKTFMNSIKIHLRPPQPVANQLILYFLVKPDV